MRPRSRRSQTCRPTSFSFSVPSLLVGCQMGTVPAASGNPWWLAQVRPTSWSPLLNTSLYSRSNLAIAWLSPLLAQPSQAASYNSLTWGGTILCPFDGRCRGPSVVSPCDGPIFSSWTEWKWPSMDPASNFTNSGKGLTHCTKIHTLLSQLI